MKFSSLSLSFVVASVLAISVGCAAPSTEEPENEPSEDQGAAVTITSAPDPSRCNSGTCTETPEHSCGGFRDSCKATSGCGTTSTGAGTIAVVKCVAIPPRPKS